MNSPALFMRECRHFARLLLLLVLLKIEDLFQVGVRIFRQKALAVKGGLIALESSEPNVNGQCMRCAKYFAVSPESEPGMFAFGDHECSGNVWAILNLFDEDRWICGESRSFSEVWASNKSLFENIGVTEWQAHETKHREKVGELLPWYDDDFYSNSSYYTRRWRDDFLDEKLAEGYVYDGGIDKYRWVNK
jgi:hypothetical protein